MEDNVIKRKCECCKEEILIDPKSINNAICYGKKHYHSGCFLSICQKRSQSKNKKTSEKWSAILNDIDQIQKNSNKIYNDIFVKDELYRFMRKEYSLVIIPPAVWNKLASIYSGTYKGMMGHGIPPSHLLDMWKRKIDFLNTTAEKNRILGNEMQVENRIIYDLSILINKYNSYLEWRRKQKIIQAERNIEQDNFSIEQDTMFNIKRQSIISKNNDKNKEEENDNISELVDDIFDD